MFWLLSSFALDDDNDSQLFIGFMNHIFKLLLDIYLHDFIFMYA